MSQRTAIVTTLRNAGSILNSFIIYHLSIGFDHIFLFFDDPNDPSIKEALNYPQVTVIRNDDLLQRQWKETRLYKKLHQFIQVEVMARQQLNVEIAIRMALERQIDWILHIDSDELFYSPGQTVSEHFESLSARNIRRIGYFNYEAVPEQADIVDYFKEVTLFIRNPSGEWISERLEDLIRAVTQLRGGFFLFYSNGKSAARVSDELLPAGVHGFSFPEDRRWYDQVWRTLRSKTLELVKTSPTVYRWLRRNLRGRVREDLGRAERMKSKGTQNPVILHYPCCGFEHFWDKYATLGAFPNKWFKSVEIRVSFHLEARDVIMRSDKRMARDFFEKRVMISDQTRIDYLIENGLFCRILEPSILINEANVARQHG